MADDKSTAASSGIGFMGLLGIVYGPLAFVMAILLAIGAIFGLMFAFVALYELITKRRA
jgi:predicted membrane protein